MGLTTKHAVFYSGSALQGNMQRRAHSPTQLARNFPERNSLVSMQRSGESYDPHVRIRTVRVVPSTHLCHRALDAQRLARAAAAHQQH